MYKALLIIFLLVAVGLITLIMLQQGKYADMGSAFSSGTSSTLFGSRGSNNFMIRMTVILAIFFFILSLVLGNLSSSQNHKDSQWTILHQNQKENKVPVETLVKSSNDIPQ